METTTKSYVGIFLERDMEIVQSAVLAAGVSESKIEPAHARRSGLPLSDLIELHIDDTEKIPQFWAEYHARKISA